MQDGQFSTTGLDYSTAPPLKRMSDGRQAQETDAEPVDGDEDGSALTGEATGGTTLFYEPGWIMWLRPPLPISAGLPPSGCLSGEIPLAEEAWGLEAQGPLSAPPPLIKCIIAVYQCHAAGKEEILMTALEIQTARQQLSCSLNAVRT